MALVKVAINGVGRIGRLLFRIMWDWPEVAIVHVNEVKGGPSASALLLEFDSMYGRWPHKVDAGEDHLTVDGRRIGFSSTARLDRPWDVDVVLECTGKWTTAEDMAAFWAHGAKKVVVSGPVDGVLNVVMGVNHALYAPLRDHIVTAASCTTNCLAPIVQVVKERFGIRHGVITTIH